MTWLRSPAGAGGVFGFGFGGLVDGVVLHQVLQWHHLVSDDVTTTTVAGLETNTLADGLFHVAALLVVVVGVALLWRAARDGRAAAGGVLTGWGVFHLVDEVLFHLVLDLHHIRMVEDYPVYDLAFTAIGVALIVAGRAIGGGRSRGTAR